MTNQLNFNKILLYSIIVILAVFIGFLSSANHAILILFFGIILASLLFIFVLKEPNHVLGIAVLFLPFTSVLSVSFSGAKISIPDALIIFLGVTIILRLFLKIEAVSISTEQSKLIIIFSLFILISFVLAFLGFYKYKELIPLPNWALSYNDILVNSFVSNIRLIIPLFFVIAIPILIRNSNDFNKLIKFFILGSTIATIYGCYEYIIKKLGLGFSFLLPGHAQNILYFSDNIDRISGTFGEPSYFAGFLVVSIFICIYGKHLNLFSELFLNILILLQVILLFLTYSTVGYFSLIAGILTYLFFSEKLKFFVSFLFLVVTLYIAYTFIPQVNIVLSKPFEQSTSQLASSSDRLNTAIAAFKMFIDSPLTGIGYGNYGFLYNSFRPQDAIYKIDHSIANNVYMDFLSSFGLIGIIFLLLVIPSFFRSLRVIKVNKNKHFPFFAGCLVSILVVYIAYPTFSFAFHWFFYSLILLKANLLKTNIFSLRKK